MMMTTSDSISNIIMCQNHLESLLHMRILRYQIHHGLLKGQGTPFLRQVVLCLHSQ